MQSDITCLECGQYKGREEKEICLVCKESHELDANARETEYQAELKVVEERLKEGGSYICCCVCGNDIDTRLKKVQCGECGKDY